MRISPIEPEAADAPIRAVLDAQARKWGAALGNHLLYARRPSIFRGVRAMWAGIDGSGLIETGLQAMVNRRVAMLNRCPF